MRQASNLNKRAKERRLLDVKWGDKWKLVPANEEMKKRVKGHNRVRERSADGKTVD